MTKEAIYIFRLLVGLTLFSCTDKKTVDKIPPKFYLLLHRQDQSKVDTIFIDSLNRNIKGLDLVFHKPFPALNSGVLKYASYGGPPDTQFLCYYTPDFGIIYTKNMTWGDFSRLHCKNDSIEKRINRYFDFIISSQSLVLAGEDVVKYADSTLKLGDIRLNRRK